MNLISKFLNFNNTCPICAEPLTLYMQCQDKMLWKASVDGNQYHFEPYKLINEPFKDTDKMILTDNLGTVDIKFETELSNSNEIKTWELNFFYLCNRSGLNINGKYGFDFNAYYACYYRGTPYMEFKAMPNKTWELKVINPDHEKVSTSDESFCFKQISPELEKVYIVNFDYEASKTRLWHYSANMTQRDDQYYEPNVFEKEMPLVSIRPKFEDQQKFIERLDGWILMS